MSVGEAVANEAATKLLVITSGKPKATTKLLVITVFY